MASLAEKVYMDLMARGKVGIYPPREILVRLGRKSKAEREEDTWFELYLWETRKKESGKGYKGSAVI